MTVLIVLTLIVIWKFVQINVRSNNYIMGVPSYIPFHTVEWIWHLAIWFYSLFAQKRDLVIKNMVIGFSARSLFQTSMEVLSPTKKLKILATPIHHHSFVSIMEQFSDDIQIMDLSDDFRELVIEEDAIKNCDVIIVTHLFGRSFDIEKLVNLKNKYKKLLLIDSIMAGSHSLTMKEDVDIDFYSCGQDKRPVAMGGAFCIVKNVELLKKINDQVITYPVQSKWSRMKKILNTFLLQKLYTSHTVLSVFHAYIKIFGLKLSDVISEKRKSNPGFEHSGYRVCPENSLIMSVESVMNMSNIIEKQYKLCWEIYIDTLDDKVIKDYYPYYTKEDTVILPYNQILIPKQQHKQFVDYCNDLMIGCIDNQNYGIMRNSAQKYYDFNDKIMNLVTVIGTENHTKNLAKAINKFYADNCDF